MTEQGSRRDLLHMALAAIGLAGFSAVARTGRAKGHGHRKRRRKRCRHRCKSNRTTCDRGCDILEGDSRDFCKQGCRVAMSQCRGNC